MTCTCFLSSHPFYVTTLCTLFALQFVQTMSNTKWMKDDCHFCKVLDASVYTEFGSISVSFQRCLPLFVKNVILTHVNAQVLLQNLHHIRVLIALAATDKLAKQGEQKWADVLQPDLLAEMNEVGACVVSWIMVKPFPAFPKCCLIDMIGSRVSGCNLAFEMIYRLTGGHASEFNDFIPCSVTNVPFWIHFLRKYYDIYCTREMEERCSDMGVGGSAWRELVGDALVYKWNQIDRYLRTLGEDDPWVGSEIDAWCKREDQGEEDSSDECDDDEFPTESTDECEDVADADDAYFISHLK